MRYYCKNCGSVLIEGDNTRRSADYAVYCPMCEDENYREVIMEAIPDYETPEQYAKRTGELWSDNGAIYYRFTDHPLHNERMREPGWNVKEFGFAKFHYQDEIIKKEIIMVCGNGNKPPPDDWKPEEVKE